MSNEDKLRRAVTTGITPLPDFLEWIADRLVRLGEPPQVDFVLSLRDRAATIREALAATQEPARFDGEKALAEFEK